MAENTEMASVTCPHGVRHPHPCDDCLWRDIPAGKSLLDHPCYGLFNLTDFSHRAYLAKDGPIYCERCGTELDRDKKQKGGAPLHWEPRHRIAHQARPSEPQGEAVELTPAQVFDMGYQFALDCARPQSREDSRAVGRLLWTDMLAPLHDRFNAIIARDGFDSFKDADYGISQCRKIIAEALSALSTPANSSTASEDEPVAWMYENESGERTFEFNPNGESARWLIENSYTETPLFASLPQPGASVEAREGSVAELIAMLASAEPHECGYVFDQSPEEVGLHVMDNRDAILRALGSPAHG